MGILRQVEDGVQPLAVMVARLLFIGQVPVGLRQRQEPPDGAQVVPQGSVLRAGVLLPSKQLTQPALQRSDLFIKAFCYESGLKHQWK